MTNRPPGWAARRTESLERDNGVCQKCGESKDDGAELEVHHKTPVSDGGTHELDNLVTLCYECHLEVHDWENHDTDRITREILDILKDEPAQRANPYLLREKTGYGKGIVNTALVRLCRDGYATRVTRGLYEYKHDPRDTE